MLILSLESIFLKKVKYTEIENKNSAYQGQGGERRWEMQSSRAAG